MATPVAADPQLPAFMDAYDAFVRAAKRGRAKAAHEGALSPAQYDLLVPLVDAESPIGLRSLARCAGVSAPTATRGLDVLVDRGLVCRRPSAQDGRRVDLTLSAEGAAVMAEHRGRILARRAALFAQLSAAERRAAAAVLSRLAEAFEDVDR